MKPLSAESRCISLSLYKLLAARGVVTKVDELKISHNFKIDICLKRYDLISNYLSGFKASYNAKVISSLLHELGTHNPIRILPAPPAFF